MKPNNMKRFVIFAGLTAIISCGGGGGGGVSTPVNSNVGNKGSATNPSTGSNRQVDDLKGIALKDIVVNDSEKIKGISYDSPTSIIMLPEEGTKALLNKSEISVSYYYGQNNTNTTVGMYGDKEGLKLLNGENKEKPFEAVEYRKNIIIENANKEIEDTAREKAYIDTHGSKSIGMLSKNGTVAINNGKIGVSNVVNGVTVGMAATNNGKAINRGKIDLYGDNSTGMYVGENSEGINDGFIGNGFLELGDNKLLVMRNNDQLKEIIKEDLKNTWDNDIKSDWDDLKDNVKNTRFESEDLKKYVLNFLNNSENEFKSGNIDEIREGLREILEYFEGISSNFTLKEMSLLEKAKELKNRLDHDVDEITISENVTGVVLGKNSKFTNNGKIVVHGEGSQGLVFSGNSTVKNYGEIIVNGNKKGENPSEHKVDYIKGQEIENVISDVSTISMRPETFMERSSEINDVNVYLDTLGRTNPIQGMEHLNLKKAGLLVGTEITETTNATTVEVPKEVVTPFAKSIEESNIPEWNVSADSLVWKANADVTGETVNGITLTKESYTTFAETEEAKETAEALDEKYSLTDVNTEEKKVFNTINKAESEEELSETIDELVAYEYANTKQRVLNSENTLDRKLDEIRKNKVESGNYVEAFGVKEKYNAKTNTVIDTKSTGYGVSYLNYNADNKLGIYAGALINDFKLEDKGKSKEKLSILKLGGYKTFDVADAEYTLGLEGYLAKNNMDRKIVIDEEIYENKGDYKSYGLALKNELGQKFELGTDGFVRPYGALKLGFGKIGNAKENVGIFKVEVKDNNYYTLKPEVGVEMGVNKKLSEVAKFRASAGLAYEHELGSALKNESKVKLEGTTGEWINLKGIKEKAGNLKTSVNLGFDIKNFGVTLNGGYNTRNKNAQVGLGLGVSF